MEPERPKSKNPVDAKRANSATKKGATAQPAPPKLTVKAKLEEKKRLQAEQERKKLQAEEQKRLEIDEARQAETRKMQKEENDRLESEMPQHYERCKRFESAVMGASYKEHTSNEWQRYIEDSEMVDIHQEKELSKLIYGMKEIPIAWNSARFQRWILFIFKVIHELRTSLRQTTAVGNKEKERYFEWNLAEIYKAIDGKMEDYVRFVIDGIEYILEKKNKQLVEKGLQTLTLENEKLNDFNRKEDRFKYEIYEPIIESDPFKYGLWINFIKAGFRAKPVAFGNMGFELEVPRQFLQSTVLISCLRSKFNRYPDDDAEIKCVGDVVELNIYQMVSLPRVTRKFTFKNITDLDQEGKPLLKKYKYEAKDGETLLGRVTLPPIFYTGENPEIVLANYTPEGGWTASKTPVQIDNKNERSAKFQANTFSVFSLALSKTIDYPYKRFFLRCVAAQEALLDLETKRLNLQFSIGRNHVKLLSSGNKIPELSTLYEEEMVSAQLLTRLEKIGIIINPSDKDVSQVPNHKQAETEDKIIKDIGFSINSFAFKQSPLNSESPSSQIVVLAKTHLDFESRDISDDEYPWEPYLFGANKCGILNPKMKTFREEYVEGNNSHVSMEKAVQERQGGKMEEFEHRRTWPELYPEFVVTLRGFLKQLKVFSLTV